MKWLVLKRAEGDLPPGLWEQLGTAETPDDGDRISQESQAVRQVADNSGIYAVVPFEEWSLHEAEARIVSHPVPKLIDPGEPVKSLASDLGRDAETPPEPDAATPELADDEDMAGLVQGPRS
jgi:hypothetical protein